MSRRLQLTVGPEDPFYQLWQRVEGGRPAGEGPAEEPEITLNEWLRRLLRAARSRKRIARSWQGLNRYLPLCRREEEILAAALYLRTGSGWEERGEEGPGGGPARDCRQLCLLFYRSGREYALAAEAAGETRLGRQLRELSEACARAGNGCEALLGEVLKRQGYI